MLDRETRERLDAMYAREDELLARAADEEAERVARRIAAQAHKKTVGLVRSV